MSNSINNKILLFCQAPADIIYILDIIEHNKKKDSIIFVPNNKSIFDFLISLKLNAEIFFLKEININFYSINSIFNARKEIKCHIYNFSKFSDCLIYFFSTSYDFLTASIVNSLSTSNIVNYYNHYDHLTWNSGNFNFSIKRELQSLIYFYICETKFSTRKAVNFPKFKYSKYHIEKIDVSRKPDINSKYLHTPSIKKESLLFLVSPDDYVMLNDHGKNKLDLLLQNLVTNYDIFGKGHPRLGVPKEIVKYFDQVIDSIIPSEFINYSCFNFIVGLSSAALCYPASKKYTSVISLLDYLDIKDNINKNDLKNYINSYSDNNISYDVSILFQK